MSKGSRREFAGGRVKGAGRLGRKVARKALLAGVDPNDTKVMRAWQCGGFVPTARRDLRKEGFL